MTDERLKMVLNTIVTLATIGALVLITSCDDDFKDNYRDSPAEHPVGSVQ